MKLTQSNAKKLASHLESKFKKNNPDVIKKLTEVSTDTIELSNDEVILYCSKLESKYKHHCEDDLKILLKEEFSKISTKPWKKEVKVA